MGEAAKKQWTVMVYLAGDNNLDGAGVVDLKEMKEVGSTDQINVIAQFDREGRKLATNRYYLRKGTTIAKDVVMSLGETNTGDPAVLEGFIRWAVEHYPARHYLLVLWNHGSGWNDENVYRVVRDTLKLDIHKRGNVILPARDARASVSIRQLRALGGRRFRRALFSTSIVKAVTTRGIAYDDAAKDFLDNLEMKRVLAAAKKLMKAKIDILGMDACLMSMAEVGYQMRNSVSLTVGSEEVEPGEGWPYHRILAKLAQNPEMIPQDLASVIVDEYVASYPANADVTQSACDLAKAGTLAGAVDKLAKALTGHLSDTTVRGAIVECRFQTQAYEFPEYVDLFDFSDLLEGKSCPADIKSACQSVKNALQPGGYVIRTRCKGKKVENSGGVSIYFPQSDLSSLYGTLDFARNTSWRAFLQAYMNATKRPKPVR